MSRSLLVYADWYPIAEPVLLGILRADIVRGSEIFSFSYADEWLASSYAMQIDPQLHLFGSEQHNDDPRNFRVFLDSCPDRWGRLLMQRREAALARQESRRPSRLNESDYLLGVHDLYRMGGLRFKLSENGPFLDDSQLAAPPISSLRELEYAVNQVETNPDLDSPDYLKWLFMLVAPGSSLGGARPKACVTDGNDLWLAKFPSRHDDHDIAAWEYLVYRLAQDAGICMASCKIQRFNSPHHTFLTKRFDRRGTARLHFASAMTQLGYYDGDASASASASYLELAQFLTTNGADTKADLAQLWRRLVFNIAVSNSDDYLRNHGFLLADDGYGWLLSPAYDINPVVGATGLHLNIDDLDNSLSFDLALEVAPYFQLDSTTAKTLLNVIQGAIRNWQRYAKDIGISKAEQQIMESVFILK